MVSLTRTKPISYLKTDSAKILRELGEGEAPMIITQNGEAKAVLQDIGDYEQTRETMALLKLLSISEDDIETGNVRSIDGLAERISKAD